VRTGLSRSLGDCVGHRFDMAVGRVVKHQNLRHDLLLNGLVRAEAERPWLGRVDHDALRTLDGHDTEDGDVLDGGAVARVRKRGRGI
jgi:hypothetical protein